MLFIVLRLLIKRRVVRKLDSVNASLDRITAGDLEEKVEVRDTYEFDTLSTDINATVDRLKEYIAEAAARIDADLAVAKAIQSSALPNVFPPFPERKEFELFASMNAAKEVGGDFYDFYMLGDHTLGFLIADVSGKSIPGAMFMMTSKTVIKSLAESGLPPAEVFSIANEKLCEGNEAEMFVTAWLGYLDLKTGLVHIANAGHNPPVLIHGGKAEYVILKPGLMLAGMDGVRYKELTLQLEKGDILYLYTDGVTEAMGRDEEQYGEDRLQKLLSFGENYPAPSGANGIAETVCDMVTADVTKFTNGAEQSDDITMLCVRYLGSESRQQYCRRGSIDIILAKSVSRFARNTVESLQYVRELKALGIAVIFEKENINTLEQSDEVLLTIFSWFAQAESESISKNVKWGIRRSFEQDKFSMAAFFGYEKDENSDPRIVPGQAETVRMIFDMFLTGSSYRNITDRLKELGRPKRNGKTDWSVAHISKILQNEKYAGDALLQKTYTIDCISKKKKKNTGELPMYYVTNHHAAIIDRDTFNKVQV